MLREARKTNSTITSWHFRRAEFVLFRDLLGRISWKTAVEGKGKACESWLIFKDNLLKAQNSAFLHAGSQASTVEGQHGWTESSLLLSSNTRRKYIKGMSRSRLSLLGSTLVSSYVRHFEVLQISASTTMQTVSFLPPPPKRTLLWALMNSNKV